MAVKREEVEALPGFLGWHTFGGPLPANAAFTYGNAMVSCSFAAKLTRDDEKLVSQFLHDTGPEDDSYLWDGSQKGWRLESSNPDIRLSIRLGRPLGDHAAEQLDALRKILGERRFNHLSAFQTEVQVLYGTDRADAGETCDGLRTAGFDAETKEEHFCQIVREMGGRRSALIVENEADRERIVSRMIQAGVPVVGRDSHDDAGVKRKNHLRRCVGLLLCFAPVMLLIASAVSAVHHGDRYRPIGLAVTLVASLIAAVNFHLSFVRGWFYKRAKGSLDGYKHISGFPLVATGLMVLGAILGFGSLLCAGLGLLCVCLDTGGSAWFLVATWKDASLWDR